ncbi:MAG: folylpolyglutamate synthase/dihydrofolate synthase family protein [Bariatricus sp.]|nr:folylpolyglutamate synthase/dihydrofolate synthase family protein [Bariatricus sp.]
MLYEEARVYLDHVSKYGSVLGLDSIKSLLGELGNPQNDLKFIHIAGTNGKGSVLACLSCILQAAGLCVGRYISPTVMDYMERFQINGQWMAEDELALFVPEVKKAAEKVEEEKGLTPTAFEIETAIAFLYFQKNACDYVVLETGMGGLLDATNIVETTEVCVFTSISMDHVGILGNTLEEIAETKSGIIKPGAVVVTAGQRNEVLEVLKKKSEECGCRMYKASPERAVILEEGIMGQRFSYGRYENLRLNLAGRYQIDNAVTVLEAVEALRNIGARISEKAVREGLNKVEWPGRFQVLLKNPLVIADGAHNRDAIKRLAENTEFYLAGKKITAVMGVFKDKEVEVMTRIMAPHLAKVYTVDLPNRERTLEKEKLCQYLSAAGVWARPAEDIETALNLAIEDAGRDGAVLVFGSLSYLGEVIRICTKRKEEMSW